MKISLELNINSLKDVENIFNGIDKQLIALRQTLIKAIKKKLVSEKKITNELRYSLDEIEKRNLEIEQFINEIEEKEKQ